MPKVTSQPSAAAAHGRRAVRRGVPRRPASDGRTGRPRGSSRARTLPAPAAPPAPRRPPCCGPMAPAADCPAARGSIAWYWRRISTAWPAAATVITRSGRRHVERPAHRGLQQRLLAEQLDQMLGEGRTAHRPQTRARPAGQDGGGEGGGKGERHGQTVRSVTGGAGRRWQAARHARHRQPVRRRSTAATRA